MENLELESAEMESAGANMMLDETESSGVELGVSRELTDSELDSYESASIEEKEFLTAERAQSILESFLFLADKPVTLARLEEVFAQTNIERNQIIQLIEKLQLRYADACSGLSLDEVAGGYQIRTRVDNNKYILSGHKKRAIRLSQAALEVLAIVAYKQPIVKSQIDEIRGVDSGHLLRALMEKGLVKFGEKSELPGRPMYYETTRKFLEFMSLRNLKELPTLAQIEELIPEGIDSEIPDRKQGLEAISDHMAAPVRHTYSEGEEELQSITIDLEAIATTTEFFEQEKRRQQEERDRLKAEKIRQALASGEEVSTRDRNWLAQYEAREAAQSGELTIAEGAGEEVAERASEADLMNPL
ncbi:MAG: SMC-Scp complex subunit ScpB [Bdellovibrionaceae bacterium]|jgi:segregation and condensation protein B|nr:SMC-Scp complex subunit ScpB [Pseudobdellovibrionaceae bacterium]